VALAVTSSLLKGQRDLVRGEFGIISLPVHCSAEVLANAQNFPYTGFPAFETRIRNTLFIDLHLAVLGCAGEKS